MAEQVRSDWFITASGRRVCVLEPDPEQIDEQDIAHALAHICRFGGHCREFYSVAQHSLLVSQIVPREHALVGLLHDATEAYVGDVIRPLKRCLSNYADIEAAWWRAICKHFRLDEKMPACVKEADLIALATERRDLVPRHSWKWIEEEQMRNAITDSIFPIGPALARRKFLERLHVLQRRFISRAQFAAYRELLHQDALAAKLRGVSVDEWEESLRHNATTAEAFETVPAAELRALECMVWKIDRGQRRHG